MNLPTLMRGSKIAAKIDAEVIDADLAARRRLVEEIERLQTSSAPRLQDLLRIMEATRAKRAAAEAAFKTAAAEESTATEQFSSFDMGLRLGTDEAIESWRRAWERARGIFSPAYSKKAPATAETMASATHIGDRCSALLEAMKHGEALKLLALSPDELEERIAAIEAAIPPAFG